jgi:hypothetical protein
MIAKKKARKEKDKQEEYIELDISLDDYDNLKKPWETDFNFMVLSHFQEGYPQKTDVSCWWCCHEFTSVPMGIPKKTEVISRPGNEPDLISFMVFGCFCSLECMYAYVLNDKKLYEKCKMFDLIYMYNQLNKDKTLNVKYKDKIIPAPARMTLKKFGGKLSIEQFRSCQRSLEVSIYPQIPQSIYVMEKKYSNDKNSYVEDTLSIRMSKLNVNQQKISQLVSVGPK